MSVTNYLQWTDEWTVQNEKADTAATSVTGSSAVGDVDEAISASVESVSEEPIFTEDQLHSILLRTWSQEPSCTFLAHINRSHLNHANRVIWRTTEGRQVRDGIVKCRAKFLRCMVVATSNEDVETACADFSAAIRNWIEEMLSFAKKTSKGLAQKKATRLEVKHRADNLTFPCSLLNLATDPSLENLRKLRSSLKELWVLRHIQRDI